MIATLSSRNFRWFVLGLALAVYAASSPILAQSSKNDWFRIERLAPGTPLIIRTSKDRRLFGRVKSADEKSLVLSLDAYDRTIEKDSVLKIFIAVHKKRNGAKLASLLTFVGVGMLLGSVDEKISPDWPTMLPFFGAAGAAALVQVELTKGFKRGELIYQMKRVH